MKKVLLLAVLTFFTGTTSANSDDVSSTQKELLKQISMSFVDGMAEGNVGNFLSKHCSELINEQVVTTSCARKLTQLKDTLTKISKTDPYIEADAKVYLDKVEAVFTEYDIPETRLN